MAWTSIRIYKKDTSAATAVEFSLLAVPFFALIFGIIELSMFYASGVSLEAAANASARVIRTGQIQGADDPISMFEDRLCQEVNMTIKCEDVIYEVINFGNHYSYMSNDTPQFDSDGNLIPSGFNPGSPEDVIMVRLAYRYNFMTPFLGQLLGGDDLSQQNIATVVLRSEPYAY